MRSELGEWEGEEKSIPGRGSSMCKGPVVGAQRLRRSNEAQRQRLIHTEFCGHVKEFGFILRAMGSL